MWKNWFPWRFFLRTAARRKGFLDPVAWVSKLQSFGQPSEVTLPIEIIRLASTLIARGSLNVVAIQHNLDWIWPYWVVRQFDPKDISFIPRAFSLTHINLTHRNWTAVGIPDLTDYPIVDPCGLLTPFFDGWSLDAWIVSDDGRESLIPSHLKNAAQKWHFEGNPSIRTRVTRHHFDLHSQITVERGEHGHYCSLTLEAKAPAMSWLVVSLRPFNPEGISEIGKIQSFNQGLAWQVNEKNKVLFSEMPDQSFFSRYSEGDVYRKILAARKNPENLPETPSSIECPSGMATAAALFRIPEGGKHRIQVQIPLVLKTGSTAFTVSSKGEAEREWNQALEGHCRLQIHDKDGQSLYDAALRSLLLHTPGIDAFPGPYTYKHFWFRDAAFILHALLVAHLPKRAEKILDHFPARQRFTGYFCSQDGEWDSNGQVLWIFRRFCELTGTLPKSTWKESIRKGADWIVHKRVSENISAPYAGLFPAGFSAEHLGPNDYYYWDDFWGVEGLKAAAFLMDRYGDHTVADHYGKEADRFETALVRSLDQSETRLGTKAMPASPHRRLDTGTIGSLAAGYPLHFWEKDDLRVTETVEYLLKNHFLEGGFFHDMSHSGINPYLTLTVAQILLRNSDPRYAHVLRRVQKLASPTGQWPEAVHPQTLGGCMGDGQHIWAAAEWVLMIRNCFVREEGDTLILCSGILPEWLGHEKKEISFGKTLVSGGAIEIKVVQEGTGMRVSWEGEWYGVVPKIEVHFPGYNTRQVLSGETSVLLSKEA